MSWESVVNATNAAGITNLNTNINIVGTPIANYFEMAENQFIRTGAQVAGHVMYRDEITQNLANSFTRNREDIIDPYKVFKQPWRRSQVVYNLAGFEIEDNLGGLRIEKVMENPRLLRSLEPPVMSTLVNLLGPRFNRAVKSFHKKKERDFITKSIDDDGSEGPDGIDIITEQGTTYAGLAYDALGRADFTSDLMNESPYLWQSLFKQKPTGTQITLDDIIAAASDVQAMYDTQITVDESKPWTYFLCSRRFYNKRLREEWLKIRRRNSASDTELGPTEQLEDSVLRIRFLVAPLMKDDKTVYFWQGGSILKAMQIKTRPIDTLTIEKGRGNRIVNVAMREAYQYRTDQRWCTGKLTQVDDFV